MITWMPGGLSYMLAGLRLFTDWLRAPVRRATAVPRTSARIAHPLREVP